MWKEVVMAYSKVVYGYLPGDTGKNHEKPQSG
jgi:hypothetical protein